jgi:hypothetical protein
MRRTSDHNYGPRFSDFKNLTKDLSWFAEVFDDLKQSEQIKLPGRQLTDILDVTNIGINTQRPCRLDIFL